MPHLVATLIYLSQIYSYYIRGDMSPLNQRFADVSMCINSELPVGGVVFFSRFLLIFGKDLL